MFGLPVTRVRLLTTIALFAIIFQSACSLKTPETKSPPPSDANNEKSFFVNNVNVGGQVVQQSKTFQCAWAPISEAGYFSSWFLNHAAIQTDHCNIEWKIEENYLLGKKVDPSLDPKDWTTIITIPITSHYKFVRDRDERGRERRDLVERTNEDHWSQRPFMKLDLTRTQIHEWSYDLLGGVGAMGGVQVLSVEDIEQSQHQGKNYWAFTLVVSSGMFGSDLQAKIRFNFFEYQHNPNFIATPYSDENSNKLNVLHVLGRKFESDSQALYNARWDLSGGNRSIEVCMYGVPNEYRQLVVDSIEEWNDVFEKIGQPRAFYVNQNRRLAYPLDLRCPTVIWITDRRVTANSPLGIGLINADVKNGQALWGSIVIYGGAFERYAKAFSPSDFASAQSDQNPMPILTAMETPFTFSRRMPYALSDEQIGRYESSVSYSRLVEGMIGLEMRSSPEFAALDSVITNRTDRRESLLNGYVNQFRTEAERTRAREMIEQMSRSSRQADRALTFLAMQSGRSNEELRDETNQTARIIQQAVGQVAKDGRAATNSFFESMPMQRLMLGNMAAQQSGSERERAFRAELNGIESSQRAAFLQNRVYDDLVRRRKSAVWDLDRTFADVAPGWHAVSASTLSRRSFDDRLKSMLKKTVSHEWGHFLGSGHNFKENILPKPGTVPQKYIDVAKAHTHKHSSAFTTVMGYDDPSIEVNIDYNEIKPGPHDEHMMRYIYNREFPVWNGTDSDFRFVSLPADGRIPNEDSADETYKTTYFEQCNDYEATLALDPYCMRHDSGYDATTLVQNYFNYLDKNWLANINNFADASRAPEWAMSRWAWRASFMAFAKVRHFYDYMLRKYANEIQQISVSSDNLMDFYKTCSGQEENTAVANIFRNADPEFLELCRVNGAAILNLKKYLEEPGSDFNEVDHNNRHVVASVMGGDANLNRSRMFGTWTRLGMLPVKYAALLTLMSPYPYIYAFPGWVWPLIQYSNNGRDYANLYSTYYPELFTQTLSATVNKNLQFKNEGGTSNSMGRPVLALGWFLNFLRFSNEQHRGVPSDYLQMVRRQTQFNVNGYVAIVLQGVKKRQNGGTVNDRIVSFNASMFDFGTREMIPMGAAFVLPDAKIIFNNPDQKSFLYPISDLQFYKDDGAYAIAVRVTFDEDDRSNLWTLSPKVALRQIYRRALDSCIVGRDQGGVKNGLQDYFNATNENFPGFLVQSGIADNSQRFSNFKNSIRAEFDKYWNSQAFRTAGNMPDREGCKNAVDALGLVVTSTVAMQGYWMPELSNYLVH